MASSKKTMRRSPNVTLESNSVVALSHVGPVMDELRRVYGPNVSSTLRASSRLLDVFNARLAEEPLLSSFDESVPEVEVLSKPLHGSTHATRLLLESLNKCAHILLNASIRDVWAAQAGTPGPPWLISHRSAERKTVLLPAKHDRLIELLGQAQPEAQFLRDRVSSVFVSAIETMINKRSRSAGFAIEGMVKEWIVIRSTSQVNRPMIRVVEWPRAKDPGKPMDNPENSDIDECILDVVSLGRPTDFPFEEVVGRINVKRKSDALSRARRTRVIGKTYGEQSLNNRPLSEEIQVVRPKIKIPIT